MYKLYEAIPKSKDNIYGQREIKRTENPFLDSPCLLCISAGGIAVDKNVFGTTKQGMKMARMRVRGNRNAGFYLENFPVKFLSIKLESENQDKKITEDERIDAFVTQYLLPLISDNGAKIDCVQAMKNMRNVNIMSYCDGTLRAQAIEEKLINKMKEFGYSDEECEKIQSQMCMFPISTNRLKGMQKSTCISFKDINDMEVSDNVTLDERKEVLESAIGEDFFEYSNNEIAYFFAGDGSHNIKKYTNSGTAMSACLSSALSKALENSILNFQGKNFVPITARTTYCRF
jgi:hypothetical protein